MLLQRLKLLRSKINQSQSTFAKNLNLSREAYSMYETGRRQPSCETLAAIASYCHVSVDYLLGLTEVPTPARGLSPEEDFLLRGFGRLDKRGQDIALTVIRHELRQQTPGKTPAKPN